MMIMRMNAEVGPRLDDLAGQDVPIAAWCLDCGHHKVLAIAPLLARLNGRTAVAAVAPRLSGGAGGGRASETRPPDAGLGGGAGHRWDGE